jgi:hypothetical protein
MADIEKNNVELEHREAGHHLHTPPAEVAFHHDVVAPEAMGGMYDEIPKRYYLSKDFIGTVTVSFRLFRPFTQC